MIRARAAVAGILICGAGLGGCSYAPRTVGAQPVPAPRSVGLVAGDSAGRFSFAQDNRIAWAADLPWQPSYRSIVGPRGTATVHVPTDGD